MAQVRMPKNGVRKRIARWGEGIDGYRERDDGVCAMWSAMIELALRDVQRWGDVMKGNVSREERTKGERNGHSAFMWIMGMGWAGENHDPFPFSQVCEQMSLRCEDIRKYVSTLPHVVEYLCSDRDGEEVWEQLSFSFWERT